MLHSFAKNHSIMVGRSFSSDNVACRALAATHMSLWFLPTMMRMGN